MANTWSVFKALKSALKSEVNQPLRAELLRVLNGVVPEGSNLSDFMLAIGEFMLRHAEDAEVQQDGARAIL